MGHSHPNATESSEPSASAIATRRRATVLLAAILAPLEVVTLFATVLLWPSGNRRSLSVAGPYAMAEGVSFDLIDTLRSGEPVARWRRDA